MKILIDTNIIVDFLLDRKPFSQEAEKVITNAGENNFDAVLTANAFTDIYYIIRKRLPDNQARNYLADLLQFMRIISVGEEDCRIAIQTNNPDLEDALMEVCAGREKVDYIVTRDEQFLMMCSIAITPANLLAQLK